MKDLKYSQLKELIKATDKGSVKAFIDGTGGYRENFTIMTEEDTLNYIYEINSDPYSLGCFSAWYIADNTNIPFNVVETLQKSEAYEALGELILSQATVKDFIEETVKDFIEEAIGLDGIGHFVNSYDGNIEEFCFNNKTIYAWRN